MLLEVGHVGRPHGLRGEVVVELVSSIDERLAPGAVLATREGRSLTVVTSRLVPGKVGPQGGRWVVKFADVLDRNASEALTGTVLFAEQIEAASGASGEGGLWVHDLIGAAVFEVSGESRGEVVSVEANPASDLLVLDSGALVPLRFVVSSEPGKVLVDVPEGLFDL